MRPAHLLALALFGSSLTGCLFNNVSTGERLRDAVTGINDEMRWSRMDLAIQRVLASYKHDYARNHRLWGRSIQVADMELLNVRVAGDEGGAMSVVAVSWYRYDTMTIHRTVIRQQWVSAGVTFALEAERVVDGDPSLLAPPEEEDGENGEDGREGTWRRVASVD